MLEIGVAKILMIHENGEPFAFTKNFANAKQCACAGDALRVLRDWLHYAKTMHEAGVIALPVAMVNETKKVLDNASVIDEQYGL